MNEPEFRPFQKIARLVRDMVITEKIDGTNGVIYIPEVGDYVDGVEQVRAGSRSRWLSTDKKGDNFGFAAWVNDNREALVTALGPGYHYGEWWGAGIQRRYGLSEKSFSLFNPYRYVQSEAFLQTAPAEVRLVPVLYEGPFDLMKVDQYLERLRVFGSVAAPGFTDPEGVVVYHCAAKTLFKRTILGDESPKGKRDE